MESTVGIKQIKFGGLGYEVAYYRMFSPAAVVPDRSVVVAHFLDGAANRFQDMNESPGNSYRVLMGATSQKLPAHYGGSLVVSADPAFLESYLGPEAMLDPQADSSLHMDAQLSATANMFCAFIDEANGELSRFDADLFVVMLMSRVMSLHGIARENAAAQLIDRNAANG